jgi:hypothetical protein
VRCLKLGHLKRVFVDGANLVSQQLAIPDGPGIGGG